MPASPGFIHRFIPGAENDRTPVLLLLHGTGGNEDDLLDLGRVLYPGAPLLSPRGKILEHGMPRFFRRLAEGVFDEKDLVERTHELAGFIEAAREEYGLGSRKIVAAGYSNGANIAASLLLLRPEIVAGAVLLRAMLPLTPPSPPDLTDVPVFLANGRADTLIPPQSAEKLAALLSAAGARVSMHWSEGCHSLDGKDIGEAARWLAGVFPPTTRQPGGK